MARDIGVLPIVAAGRVNCEVLSLVVPRLLENVLERAALVNRPSEVLYSGCAAVMPPRPPSIFPSRYPASSGMKMLPDPPWVAAASLPQAPSPCCSSQTARLS